MLRCALFDLDNTLYPASSGVMREIGRRMNRFMAERLGIPEADVSGLRDGLCAAYGTTLNGLRRSYEVDPDDFLAFVHDLPLDSLIGRDAALDRMLDALPLRKAVFTNADAAHARRVLTRLGVLRHFEAIIDIHLVDFCNKPDPRAYRKALEFLGARAEECVLLEDHPANIRTARALGMATVLVGGGGDVAGVADCAIDGVADFMDVLGRLSARQGARR